MADFIATPINPGVLQGGPYSPGDVLDITNWSTRYLQRMLDRGLISYGGGGGSSGGLGYVNHGSDNTVARPTGFDAVLWKGDVLPDNIQPEDIWAVPQGDV